MRKKLWIITLVIGVLPFIATLILSIYWSIKGTSFFCWTGDCEVSYGFEAFYYGVLIYAIIFWPIYIIATILIFVSVKKLKKENNR